MTPSGALCSEDPTTTTTTRTEAEWVGPARISGSCSPSPAAPARHSMASLPSCTSSHFTALRRYRLFLATFLRRAVPVAGHVAS